MQLAPINADVVAKVALLQLAVNNLINANNQALTYDYALPITASHITALTAAMTTLQADVVTINNTIPAVVAGN